VGRVLASVACLTLFVFAGVRSVESQGVAGSGPPPEAKPVDQPVSPQVPSSPGDTASLQDTASPDKKETSPDKTAMLPNPWPTKDAAQPNQASSANQALSANQASPADKASSADKTAIAPALVSVESSLPWLTGHSLRKAIGKQTDLKVFSPAEDRARQQGATAEKALLLVIAVSRRGEVTLVCREAPEGMNWLRVKPPIRSVLDATATLAAAVLGAAYEYRTKQDDLRKRAIENAALSTPRQPPADAALDSPANPYHGRLPHMQSRPYIPPYNPYYLGHL